MTFHIEFSDQHFLLVILESNGEESYQAEQPFCSVSSAVAADGRVYGLYLRGSETQLTAAEKFVAEDPDPLHISMPCNSVPIYDITDFPTVKPLAGPVVKLVPTDFDSDESGDDDEGSEDSEGETIDVTPIV
jgi:hypothetical protein